MLTLMHSLVQVECAELHCVCMSMRRLHVHVHVKTLCVKFHYFLMCRYCPWTDCGIALVEH